jgi:hypothetical protein
MGLIKKVVAGVFALVVSLGAGCVTMTPEEIATEYEGQLKMSTRVYLDKKAEDVILAADRVFRLADDDYAISYSPYGPTCPAELANLPDYFWLMRNG